MRAVLALLVISALWVPYCLVLVFGHQRAEYRFEGLFNGLIEWAR